MALLWELCLLCTVIMVHGDPDVRLPPSIIRHNTQLEVFLAIDSKFTLICDADGSPDPEYEWYQDGDIWQYQSGEVTVTPGSGNITINSFSYTHAGEFHCIASNQYGKAMTRKINVRMAFIAKFPTQDDIPVITKREDQPLKFVCDVPKSEPAPTISWRPVESLDLNPQSTTILMTRRVQIDDEGNLVFAYVTTDDEINNWYYRCFVENTIAGLSAFGSYAQLTVNTNNNPGGSVMPSIQAYTGETTQGGIVTALKRQPISLRCLFAGMPEPAVTWSRKDNKALPMSRINYEEFDTVMIISNVEDYDEAVYICAADNTAGTSSHEITVQVEAIPEYKDNESRPKNTNFTDGAAAMFKCVTDAEPVAKIIWYKNSEVLTGDNMPERVSISDDRMALSVSKVCKDCRNGGSDLMVYACEAVNIHGSAFSSGYLNVLLPTVITVLPTDYDLTLQETEITFTCEGITDDSTPMMVEWHLDGDRINYIENEIFAVVTDSGSTLVIITEELEHHGKEYIGNYTCVLTNGYSRVNATAALNEIPGAVPVTSGSLADIWWVL